jgi:hypothetical protein
MMLGTGTHLDPWGWHQRDPGRLSQRTLECVAVIRATISWRVPLAAHRVVDRPEVGQSITVYEQGWGRAHLVDVPQIGEFGFLCE